MLSILKVCCSTNVISRVQKIKHFFLNFGELFLEWNNACHTILFYENWMIRIFSTIDKIIFRTS